MAGGTGWRYAQGDVVRLADGGGVYAITSRERACERGRTVPAYEAMEVRGRHAYGAVRLIRDAAIDGRFDPRDDERD